MKNIKQKNAEKRYIKCIEYFKIDFTNDAFFVSFIVI